MGDDNDHHSTNHSTSPSPQELRTPEDPRSAAWIRLCEPKLRLSSWNNFGCWSCVARRMSGWGLPARRLVCLIPMFS